MDEKYKESSELKEYVFITPVWGDGHTKLFLDVCLPSLLARDNIPALSKRSKVKYFIYIKSPADSSITKAPILKKLQEFVEVSLIVFDDHFSNNHSAMSWCHKAGFNYAVEHGSYAVFIPPDCVWSNQAMLSMHKIVENGYKIIHMSGIRISSELFCPELTKYKGNINLTPRELVKIALQYLHPITCSHFFDEKGGGLMPANLFWTVDETGLIARCFHLHPLLVYGTPKQCDFKSTIDDDLALAFDSAENEEYIVADSDELVAFEMSSHTHKVLAAYRKGNTDDIAMWAETCTNKKHQSFIKTVIKIHAENALHPGWSKTEAITTKVVDEILGRLASRRKDALRKWAIAFRCSQYIKKIKMFYISIIGTGTEYFSRLTRSSKGLYPWHWNFAFQIGVCNPFVNEVRRISGSILYFDDSYHPLIHEINHYCFERKDLQISLGDQQVLINNVEAYSRLYKNHYDRVIVRDFNLPLSDDFLGLVRAILKPNGRLIYYTTDNKNIFNFLSKTQNKIKIISEDSYGGFGTKISINFYHWYYSKIKPAMPRATVTGSVKLLLLPVIFILYPMLSICTQLLNAFMGKKYWAVKRFDFCYMASAKEPLSNALSRTRRSDKTSVAKRSKAKTALSIKS
jgi:hypothetical protein